MDDYYELLDVAPDAERDEIRGAYRAKRDELQAQDGADARSKIAELNRAWNVLSDPTQRRRYDERLAESRDEDYDDDEYEDDEDEGDGDRRERSVPVTRAQRRDEMRRARQQRMTATVKLPNGLVLAPTKTRLLALATDVAILLALFTAVTFVGQAQLDHHFPGERTHASHLQTRVDALKKEVSDAKKAVSTAKDKHETAAAAAAQKRQDKLQKKQDAYQSQIDAIGRDFAPGVRIIYAIGVLVCFLYLVPLTARTGQTIGKRLRKIRVAKMGDGSVPGWVVATKRFGVPLGLALVLGLVIQDYALLIGLVVIVGWVNRPDRQGLHDRLAKTVVVEA